MDIKMNGKGSKRRPSSCSNKEFEERWNEAFNKNKLENNESKENDLITKALPNTFIDINIK